MAVIITIPNKQMAIKNGDFNTSLKPWMPVFVIRHILNAMVAAQSNSAAIAKISIIGVKRNLKFLASWGADCFFIRTL